MALVSARCFNQAQARLNLFCERLRVNLTVPKSMKQAGFLKVAEAVIRKQVIG